jgi:hypothetical protein
LSCYYFTFPYKTNLYLIFITIHYITLTRNCMVEVLIVYHVIKNGRLIERSSVGNEHRHTMMIPEDHISILNKQNRLKAQKGPAVRPSVRPSIHPSIHSFIHSGQKTFIQYKCIVTFTQAVIIMKPVLTKPNPSK